MKWDIVAGHPAYQQNAESALFRVFLFTRFTG
jgi:hypothetical protein